MTMTWIDFTTRVVVAILLGSLVGLERQWRQRNAGLRTNALVAVGASIFVTVGISTPNEGSPTAIAAQVVSGIGFLGAGVIMRSGLSVSGLNTAATLWCSASVGVLCGMGRLQMAGIATVGILAANVLLRPVARKLIQDTHEHQNESSESSEVEITYRVRAICRVKSESHVRTLLLQAVQQGPMRLRALSSGEGATPDKRQVAADLISLGKGDALLEQLVSRLSLEQSVSSISWEVVAETDVQS